MDTCSLLQEQIDKTGKDMYATLEYLNTKHDYRAFDGQIKVTPAEKDQIQPDEKEVFDSERRRMASDVIGDAKRFDELLLTLPGLERNEDEQMARIASLQQSLSDVEKRYISVLEHRDQVHADLERLITTAATTIRMTR